VAIWQRAGEVWPHCGRPDLSALRAGPAGRATNSMSADSGREFVDANVLVYLDTSAGAKQAARPGSWNGFGGCLSVQVLQEFFVIVTRKVVLPLSIDEAAERIREFARWRVFAPAAEDVLAAIAFQKQMRISFWDAMVVLAAAESECHVLWTEDLNDWQVLGRVRVLNPFVNLKN